MLLYPIIAAAKHVLCRADGGNEAASMRIAEQYLTAFGGIAKAGTTLLLPASSNDPASMVAQALSIYNNVSKTPLANPRYALLIVFDTLAWSGMCGATPTAIYTV